MNSIKLLLILMTSMLAQPFAAQTRQPSSTVSLTAIEDLIHQRRFFEAKTEAQNVIAAHPTNVEALNLLGIIEGEQHNDADAIATFDKALKIAPNSTKTRNNLANIFVAEKQFDLAEKQFEFVLRVDPSNRDANYNLGMLLLSKGSAARAIPHFARVRPQNNETRFNLVHAYLETKQSAEALRVAGELSAESKNDVQMHFSLGLLLASERQYSPAVLEFEKAEAIQPDTFEIVYNLGQALIRNGKFAEAGLALNRALKLKPDSAETLYLLAQTAMSESHPLDALDLLIRAHKIAPENIDVIFLMARLSISQNYFEDAIPLLESGLKIAPGRSDLIAALGESYFMAGKVDKSVEVFKQLVEVEPSARSYGFVALSYRNLGRFEEAKQYVSTGLKLDPNNISCLFTLGVIAEGQGDSTKAASIFQQILRRDPDFPDALMELANVRVAEKQFQEADDLLKKYIKVSHSPAGGYYKLAIVERNLHQAEAAARDMDVFQTLSKNRSSGPNPFENLFGYLDVRSQLDPKARGQLDIDELVAEIKRHPDQPEDLYFLAEAYFKAGKLDEGRSAIHNLDELSSADYRTLAGAGVLLARYRLYDDAIQHFQLSLKTNPNADDVKFDLANAYFKKRLYSQALDTVQELSEESRKDNACQALLGDIYAHLGDTARATAIFQDLIARNPDSDQDYLSLALAQLREDNIATVRDTLLKGQARIPASGKLTWGLGLVSALQGDTAEASRQLERAVDLLPEWQGSYSTLGVFYFETGQVAKAKEVLNRFKNSSVGGSLDIGRIEQVLERAPESTPAPDAPLSQQNRAQLIQFALSVADRTL